LENPVPASAFRNPAPSWELQSSRIERMGKTADQIPAASSAAGLKAIAGSISGTPAKIGFPRESVLVPMAGKPLDFPARPKGFCRSVFCWDKTTRLSA